LQVIAQSPQDSPDAFLEGDSTEFPVSRYPPRPADVDNGEAGAPGKRARLLRVGMQELGAEFNRRGQLRYVECPDPAADSVARVQYRHIAPPSDEPLRGGETGGARANNDDVVALQASTLTKRADDDEGVAIVDRADGYVAFRVQRGLTLRPSEFSKLPRIAEAFEIHVVKQP